MKTKSKKRLKWSFITVIEDGKVPFTISLQNEKLPKGFYERKHNDRTEDKRKFLGMRPELYGNFKYPSDTTLCNIALSNRPEIFGNDKDPPDATARSNTLNDLSTQTVESNIKTDLQNSKEKTAGQKEVNGELFDSHMLSHCLSEMETYQEDQYDYFANNDPFNIFNNSWFAL